MKNKEPTEDFLGVNVITLRLCGLWNSFGPKGDKRLLPYTVFSHAVAVLLWTHVFTEAVELYISWGDMDATTANASTLLTYGAAVIKQTCFLAESGRIYRLVYALRPGGVLSKYPGGPWKHQYTAATHRGVRIMSWSYYGLGIGCLSGFLLGSVTTSYPQLFTFSAQEDSLSNVTAVLSKQLPYRAWFPVDMEHPGVFEVLFSFQVLVILFGPTLNIGIDTLFVGLIIHAVGHFEILSRALRELEIERRHSTVIEVDLEPQTEEVEGGDDVQEEEAPRSKLVECVKYHQNLLEFISEMESLFHAMMFAQFLSSSGTLCLIIFQITVTTDQGIGLATQLQFFAISVMQLLLYCWHGNELSYQSEGVLRAVYETPWVSSGPEYGRSVMIIGARSLKPLRLTGGKLYITSLDTFLNIMKASFSYFTVLRQLNGS